MTTTNKRRPIYQHETVTYRFVGKWEFKTDGFTLLTALKGGSETAHKVARIVAGALKRTGGKGIDPLARRLITLT